VIEDHQIPPLWKLPIPVKNVVDLGCNDGTTTEHYCKMFPNARVMGVELDIDVGDIAAQRIWKYGSRAYILNQAIGWPEGWGTAYIDSSSTVSTLTPYQSRTTTERKVRVLSLDSVLDIEDFQTVDFMKIDIEGAELSLFESTEWVDKTTTFLVECHSEEAIWKFSTLKGFEVLPLLSDPAWGNHLFARKI
jgi:FkbM family methyltransferase